MMAPAAVASMAVNQAAMRRGRAVLLLATFFVWAGFFMVVPLIAVHYVEQMGWTAASIGLVLGLRQFTQQGVTVLGGVLADRLGAKGPICAGMLVRALGFLAMAVADTYAVLLLSALLMAVGGALFESPKAAAIAALTNEAERPRFYALVAVVGGLGVTLGTQTGALLIRADFALVSLGGAACFFLVFWLVLLFLPPVWVAEERRGLLDGLRLALHDRPFVTFNALMLGYWFLWTQFYISLPLAAQAITGTPDAVAWSYAVNSGVTVLLGYPLPRLLDRRLRPVAMLVLGIVLTALGLAAVGFATGTAALLLCVLVISLGTVLARPAEQTIAASLADPAALGSYFGAAALSIAVGGGAGNFAGGLLYDLGQELGRPALPWLLFSLVGLITAAGLWLSTPTRHPARRRLTTER